MLPLLPPPPTRKRRNLDQVRAARLESRNRTRKNRANLRVRSWLLRYLHEINRLNNRRLSLVTLQQILKLQDPCGAHHRERILKYVPRKYKAEKRERLLKVAAELLDELSKEISENLEDLGGAA